MITVLGSNPLLDFSKKKNSFEIYLFTVFWGIFSNHIVRSQFLIKMQHNIGGVRSYVVILTKDQLNPTA